MYMWIYIYICIYVDMYICIHIYICIYINICIVRKYPKQRAHRRPRCETGIVANMQKVCGFDATFAIPTLLDLNPKVMAPNASFNTL